MKNFVTAQSSGVGWVARRDATCENGGVRMPSAAGPHVHVELSNSDRIKLNIATRRTPAEWNRHPFTCPQCHRNWDANLIRICRLGSRMVCQRCRDSVLDRPSPNQGKKIAVTPETVCKTCNTPIGKRRAVTNKWNQIVHYRCPKKK